MRTSGTRPVPGVIGCAMSLLLLTPASAVTQEAPAGDTHPNWELGAAVTGNFLTGVSSDLLDGGFGFLGFAGRRATGPLWVRLDASYFGLEEQSGQSEVADNALLSLLLGPEVGFGSRLLRGYLRGYGGLVVNFQSRSGSSFDTLVLGQAEREWRDSPVFAARRTVPLRLLERAGVVPPDMPQPR